MAIFATNCKIIFPCHKLKIFVSKAKGFYCPLIINIINI